MISLTELIRHLQRSADAMPARILEQHARNGVTVAGEAAEYIGRELPEWPPLAPWTVEEKTRLGYINQVSPTDPGLRTGAMQKSIDSGASEAGFVVGSADKKLLWFELGRRATPLGGPQPPRPVLALVMSRNLAPLADTYGRILARALTPPSTGKRIE